MSTQTNNAFITKSMNGIISYDDGAGGTMEGGIITANELKIDAIQSTNPPNVVSLFTDTTTIINCGSSTSVLNVSNLNVSNINLPSITFTTLNASTVNADDVNTSTSNSSTSNSSTSNSSTSNSSTSNSSTTNSSTSNSTTSNVSTLNASTSNLGTASGTTMNISTINASIINTNEIQVATTGNVSLYTNISGTFSQIRIGTPSTLSGGSEVYIDAPLITSYEIIGQNYISTTDLRTDIIQSGSTNAICDIYTNASVDQITIGRSGTICYMNSSLYCDDGIYTNKILALNPSINHSLYDNMEDANLFIGSLTATGDIVLRTTGGLIFGAAASSVKMGQNASNIEIGKNSTGSIIIGNANASLNASKIICSNIASTGGNITTLQCTTLNNTTGNITFVKTKYVEPVASEVTNDVFLYSTTTTGLISIGTGLTTGSINMGSPTSIVNIPTINASTYNAININASYIATNEIYADYAELGNINISSNTIGVLSPTATVDLFPTLTTGTLNIGTNMTTTGAITMGNAASTGSFSLSEGIINFNPKTTLNIANQIGTGTTNICNNNAYAGTLNLCATAHTNSATLNTLNIGSSTCNVSIIARGISINSNNDIDIFKPISPQYSVFSGTGTSAVNTIGYMFSFSSNTVNANMPTSGTYYSSAIFNSIPMGVYILYWYNEIFNNGANSVITSTFMAGGSTATNRNLFNQQCGIGNMTLGAGRTFGFPITYPVSIPATQALHLSVMMVYSGGTLRNNGTTTARCYMVRIA